MLAAKDIYIKLKLTLPTQLLQGTPLLLMKLIEEKFLAESFSILLQLEVFFS